MIGSRRPVLWTVVVVTLMTVVSFAQQSNVGGITGTVEDSSGAVIRGATVEVVNSETGVTQSTTTSDGGVYVVNFLQIGTYSVTITKTGFRKLVSQNIKVIAGQTTTANGRLAVGEATETVSVNAQALQVNTTDTSQGTTRTLEELQDLPINLEGTAARSAMSAVQTFSGVNFNPQQSSGGAVFVVSRSKINGLDGSVFGFEIDGVQASTGESENAQDWVSPTPNQIAEVRVTNNTDATQGFNGGTTIALVTKSGTNQVHGDINYFNRNDALEARNWFLPAKAEDKQSEGGWTLGGPVHIPHVYNGRDKTFFFASMDIFRYVTTATPASQSTVNTVPTDAMRTGDFSALLGAKIGTDALGRNIFAGEIYDPTTTRTLANGTTIRDPYMYNGKLNVIPPSELSSVSKFFGSHYSEPTNTQSANNWVGLSAQTYITKDQWALRIDQAIGQKHRITFSVEHQLGLFDSIASCPYGGYGNYGSVGYVDNIDAASSRVNCANMYRYRFNYTWTITPSIVLDFRGGITRDPHRNVTPPASQLTAGCDAGLKNVLSCYTPRVGIENYSAIGPSTWYVLHSQRTPFDMSLTLQRRKHLITTGIDYVTSPFVYANRVGEQGSYSFNHLETSLPGTYANQTGAGIASFYSGAVHSGAISFPTDGRFSSAEGALFVQDKWLVTPKLTVNVGLRWELTFPGHERNNKLSGFDPTLANPGAGGRPGALSIGLKQVGDYYYKAFAPKIGLAYAIDPKTVFRANFGISYYPYWNKWYNSNGVSIPADGFGQTKTLASLNNGVTAAYFWDQPFPYTFPTFPIKDPTLDNNGPINYVDPRFIRPPMVENIGAEIERQLPWRIIVRAGYVGTMGHREYASYNLNQLPLQYLTVGSLLNQSITSTAAKNAGYTPPYTGFTGTVAQSLLPYPQYTAVTNLEAQIGGSSYNSFQLNVQRHFGSLTFLANFTASKYLTTSDNPGNGNQLATLKSQSYQLPSQAKSLGGYQPISTGGQSGDVPKQANMSWYWKLPFGPGMKYLSGTNGAVNAVVSEWRVSALQYYQAGLPIGVTSNVSIPSFGSVWPVLNPGVPIISSSCSALNGSATKYLNKAAFSDPAPYTLGNVYVLPDVRLCGYASEDFGVDKGFSLGESRHFRLGMTITNVFNRHQFNNLTTNIDSANFGTYGGASQARTVQLRGQFDF